MTQVLLLGVGGAEPLRQVLAGVVTAGGSRADALHVPGLPPGALRLEPRPTGVVVQSRVPGLHVAGKPVAPGARRLLRPGERARLLALELSIAAPPRGEGTRTAAAAYLRDAAMGPARAAALLGPALVVLDGPDAGRPLPLEGEQVLGRSRGARLRLDDPAASRRHARVRLVPGGATVEDLGARNGLRVNGVPVERGPVPLHPGDVLTVGETSLAFQTPEAAGVAPARTTPAPARPPRRARLAPRVPLAREPVAPLLGAVLLGCTAAALLAAACGG